MGKRKKIFFILAVSAVLCACSKTEPRIPYSVMRLVYWQGPSGPEERFTFFVIAEDDDGVENLSELYLYHDWEGLRWKLSAEDWAAVSEDGKTWIGSRGIGMPGGVLLPRGQYRAVLVNKGGDQTERTFGFDVPEEPRYPFPVFSIREGRYNIESQYPKHSFLCYDESGNYLRTIPAEIPQGEVSALGLPSNVKSIALWAEDAEYQTSALTNISPIR